MPRAAYITGPKQPEQALPRVYSPRERQYDDLTIDIFSRKAHHLRDELIDNPKTRITGPNIIMLRELRSLVAQQAQREREDALAKGELPPDPAIEAVGRHFITADIVSLWQAACQVRRSMGMPINPHVKPYTKEEIDALPQCADLPPVALHATYEARYREEGRMFDPFTMCDLVRGIDEKFGPLPESVRLSLGVKPERTQPKPPPGVYVGDYGRVDALVEGRMPQAPDGLDSLELDMQLEEALAGEILNHEDTKGTKTEKKDIGVQSRNRSQSDNHESTTARNGMAGEILNHEGTKGTKTEKKEIGVENSERKNNHESTTARNGMAAEVLNHEDTKNTKVEREEIEIQGSEAENQKHSSAEASSLTDDSTDDSAADAPSRPLRLCGESASSPVNPVLPVVTPSPNPPPIRPPPDSS